MIASFKRFQISMTKETARECAQQGSCDADVAEAVKLPAIRRQLNRIPIDVIRAELAEYDAWSEAELADAEVIDLQERIVGIAAGMIVEDLRKKADSAC